MSVQAGGLGITLTNANRVYHYDHWWNPALHNQADGRAHRIGQKKNVIVQHLYTLDTVEQGIYRLLERKQSLFDAVIDDLSTEDIVGKLTDEELFGLIGLPPPGAKDQTAKEYDFRSMGDVAFEKLVAELYRKQGYLTQTTLASHDGGIDVIARKLSSVSQGEYIIIQCKRYTANSVSVQTVRELAGVLSNKPEATGAVLVTSGTFTDEAKAFAAKKESLVLIDGNRLRGELQRLGINITGKT